MYIQFDTGRVYVHDDTEDRYLLQERIAELLADTKPSTPRDAMKRNLPGWVTVLAFFFMLLSVLAIGYMVREVFLVN